jgi:glycosyltransferase involved in cell wall biosynthesis
MSYVMVDSCEKISVLIPVYNTELYLERCLESVVGQSYDNLEVILVDDGSTDRSGEICDRYSNRDRRVRVIHQENRGEGAARNTGLKCMTGNYFYFVDSDDYIDTDAIKNLWVCAQKSDADLVVGNMSVIEEERVIKKNPPFGYEEITPTVTADTGFRYAYFYSPGIGCPVWQKLYRTAFYRKTRLLFDERLRIAADYLFNFFLFFYNPKIQLLDNHSYYYCHYASTLTKSRTPDLLTILLLIQEQQYHFLADRGALEENEDVILFSIFGSLHKICHQTYLYSRTSFKDAKRDLRSFMESPIPARFVESISRADLIQAVPRTAWRWYARLIGQGLKARFYGPVALLHFLRFQF